MVLFMFPVDNMGDSKADHGASFPGIYEYPGRWLWEDRGHTSVYALSQALLCLDAHCGIARGAGHMDP